MSNASPSLTGKRVVIVEDEEILHLQMRKALHAAGLQVIGGALNAQDGIDVVLSKRPDIVLMDIHMPGTNRRIGRRGGDSISLLRLHCDAHRL
jgi:DNA-binding NarL/FixJ family response regulator